MKQTVTTIYRQNICDN